MYRGDKFHERCRLTRVSEPELYPVGQNNRVLYKAIYECSCNKNRKLYRCDKVNSGHSLSCGCLSVEIGKSRVGEDHPSFKHGLSGHPLKNIHQNIIDKLYNPNAESGENVPL